VQAITKFQEEINGPLKGGDLGQRLIKPSETAVSAYFQEIPAPFVERSDEWLIIPLYHIFGSEELSNLSPAIAEKFSKSYIGLNTNDMKRLQIKNGEIIELYINNINLHLPVVCMDTLHNGIAGIPAGLQGLEGVILPVRTKSLKRKEM
jgi:NADH-quinone oxidoreductase subunit G